MDRKTKIKKLVFGTLVTGGALGLAGVNAQAHGNAASHKTVGHLVEIKAPDDYDVKRQEAPKSPTQTVALDAILSR